MDGSGTADPVQDGVTGGLCRGRLQFIRGTTAGSSPASSVVSPVASTKTVSPSARVCTGLSARAIPAWAAVAVRLACATVSTAFVATTTRVVFNPSGPVPTPGAGAGPEPDAGPDARPDAGPDARSGRGAGRRAERGTWQAFRRVWIPGQSDGVHDGQRADHHCCLAPTRVRDAVPVPPLNAPRPSAAPAPAPALPRATPSCSPRSPRSLRRLISHRRVRPRAEIPAAAQVKNGGGRHDRYHAAGHRKAAARLLTPSLDAGRRGQSVGAATGQHDGVHRGDQRRRVKGIRLMRARAAAADVDGADAPRWRQHDGDPAQPAVVRPLHLAHPDARDIGDGAGLPSHGLDRPRPVPSWHHCAPKHSETLEDPGQGGYRQVTRGEASGNG